MIEVKEIRSGKLCPYCEVGTELVSGDIIYPYRSKDIPRPKFLDKKYYVCTNNKDHYVGTYKDNVTALGRLADAELRTLKSEGHAVFDPLWKDLKTFKSQKDAYHWLSKEMNLSIEFTHFGMFSVTQCIKAIEKCKELSNQ
ncbi:DUF3268 family zinc-finger domain-containing protein [Crocinitomicaceae bacterium]|nr:DUF3268 family zinc-finger domain-containing protein [Crocinitomicaceae bacterium]